MPNRATHNSGCTGMCEARLVTSTMPLIVTKKQKESTGAFLRRFSRVVQQSGILMRVRNFQYRTRPATARIEKKNALHRMTRRRETDKLRKLGKIE